MDDQNTHANDKPERELSSGSKLRFWKQAYLAAIESGLTADDASVRAELSIKHYNSKFKELFPS